MFRKPTRKLAKLLPGDEIVYNERLPVEEEMKPLTYNVGDVLAFTIAPDETLQFRGKINRYQTFYQTFYDKLERLFNEHKIPYYFTIELSEPIGVQITSYPRLHLHGIIHLKTKVQVFKFLLEIFPELTLNNMISIKHTDESAIDGWVDYIHQQQCIMPKSSILSNSPNIDEFLKLLFPLA